jgi:hypothetical protein
MKNALRPYFLIHALAYTIALIFVVNAHANKPQFNLLEGDLIYIPAGSFLFGTKKTCLEKLSLLGYLNRGILTKAQNKIFFSKPSTLIAMR